VDRLSRGQNAHLSRAVSGLAARNEQRASAELQAAAGGADGEYDAERVVVAERGAMDRARSW
jgi:hypothetical protein